MRQVRRRTPARPSGIGARSRAEALQLKEDQRLDRRRCRVKKGTLRIEDVAALMVYEQVQYIGRLLT